MVKEYSYRTSLGLDDILALRHLYQNKNPFFFQGHEYVYVRDTTELIAKNFFEKEFVSSCEGYAGNFLNKELIDVIQLLRENYGPIRVTSTFRDEDCNHIVGGVRYSQHQLARAVDFQFLSKPGERDFRKEIKNRGCIFYIIVNMGANSIILYPNHVHIDFRENYIDPIEKASYLETHKNYPDEY